MSDPVLEGPPSHPPEATRLPRVYFPPNVFRFFDACLGVEPIRVRVGDPARPGGSELLIDKPFFFVGSDPRSDVLLSARQAPGRVLYFQLVGGRLFCMALADSPPVLVNGRAWESGWVRPSDEFHVAGLTLRVDNPDHRPLANPHTASNPVSASKRRAGYSLAPLASRSGKQFHYQQRLVVLGQSPPAHFVARHASVSRCHAAVVQAPSGELWAVDLLSRTGVAVNGKPALVAEVRSGDVLTLGAIGVRIQVDDPSQPPPDADRADDLARPTTAAAPPLDVLLEQVTAFQQETFDRFQTVLDGTVKIFMGVLADQRQASREELDRLERIILAINAGRPHLPAVSPAAAAPSRPPTPALPSLVDLQPVPADTPPADPSAGQALPAPVAVPAPSSQDGPKAKPALSRPPVEEAELHSWIEEQLGAVRRERSTAWDRFLGMLNVK